MSGQVLQFSQQQITITCFRCGIVFSAPEYWKEKRLEDRDTFWCPNGHAQQFIGETEAERLRRVLAAKERELNAG